MKQMFGLALAALLLMGCQTQRFDLKPSTNVTTGLEEEQKFFVGGPGQTQTVDAAQACGGAAKVSSIETLMSFGNGFVSVVTLGIYSPRQIRITCVK